MRKVREFFLEVPANYIITCRCFHVDKAVIWAILIFVVGQDKYHAWSVKIALQSVKSQGFCFCSIGVLMCVSLFIAVIRYEYLLLWSGSELSQSTFLNPIQEGRENLELDHSGRLSSTCSDLMLPCMLDHVHKFIQGGPGWPSEVVCCVLFLGAGTQISQWMCLDHAYNLKLYQLLVSREIDFASSLLWNLHSLDSNSP